MSSKEYNKRYYLEHKEKFSKQRKERYQANKGHCQEYWRKWKENNREKTREYARKYKREHREGFYTSGQASYESMRSHLRKRGLPCLWDKESFLSWFQEQKKQCYYCKQTLSPLPTSRLEGLTLDRLDNTKGYEIKNVALCCGRCNVMKGSWLTADQMLDAAGRYFIGEGNNLHGQSFNSESSERDI